MVFKKLIQADNVSKEYQRGPNRVTALRDVSFEVGDGESVALLGKSGSGKTTLLNLLAGLDRASSGRLDVNGICLSDCSKKQLDRYRQQSVGVVFQQFRLIKHRTAEQNVEFPLEIAGLRKSERKARVAECLKRVGLQDRAHHRPSELSGGEQQRIAVARAISNSPRVLLADEPTGNLDSKNATQVMELLMQIRAESGSTLVLITHDEEIASAYTDRMLRLVDGSVIDSGLKKDSPTDAPHALQNHREDQ